jgi:hypothetical protein
MIPSFVSLMYYYSFIFLFRFSSYTFLHFSIPLSYLPPIGIGRQEGILTCRGGGGAVIIWTFAGLTVNLSQAVKEDEKIVC